MRYSVRLGLERVWDDEDADGRCLERRAEFDIDVDAEIGVTPDGSEWTVKILALRSGRPDIVKDANDLTEDEFFSLDAMFCGLASAASVVRKAAQ